MKQVMVLIALCIWAFMVSFNSFDGEHLTPDYEQVHHQIVSNDEQYELTQVLDKQGHPCYYYRDFHEFPCHGEDECRMMRIRIYWDSFGNFMKYHLLDGVELTKLNHKEFSEKEYTKLHKILNNPGSELQFCKYENLTSHQAENTYHTVDAVSSATVQTHKFEYITGAVKTTWVLWHFTYGQTAEEVKKKTTEAFGQNSENLKVRAKLLELDAFENLPDTLKLQAVYAALVSNNIGEHVIDCAHRWLHNDEAVYFNSALEVLRRDEKLVSSVKDELLNQLNAGNGFNQILAYNLLQQKGERKALKQVDLCAVELNATR